MRGPKLDREAQQIFDTEAGAAIRESNTTILPQMLASDEILESTTSEKIKELQDEQNRQFPAKIELKLDAYLRDENDKTFFDDENVSRKQHHHQAKNITQCMLKDEIT